MKALATKERLNRKLISAARPYAENRAPKNRADAIHSIFHFANAIRTANSVAVKATMENRTRVNIMPQNVDRKKSHLLTGLQSTVAAVPLLISPAERG